jgi:hypothetical protein
MFELDNIQERGFRNVSENGKVVGFQVPFRTSYYRGVWLSQIQVLFEITVDGETFKGDQVQFSTLGKTYEQKDFQSLSEVYWKHDELAYLIVKKPGGLKAGVHNVGLSYGNTVCYSRSYDIRPNTFTRSMVLCK